MKATLNLRRDELAKYRVRAGLTTAQKLADAMGASRLTVSAVIHGRTAPSAEFVASLTSALSDHATLADLWEVLPKESQ